MNQSRAQIYKSDLRGCEESEVFRRYCTFNFDSYQDHSRQPFGALLALNDETLGGGHKIFRHVEEAMEIIIIPLVGGILYKDSCAGEEIIGTEEIRIFSAQKGMHYELTNPYDTELVNYLQLWIRPQQSVETNSRQAIFELSDKNKLIPLFAPDEKIDCGLKINSNSYGSIGIYEGRKERSYTLQHPGNGLFAFVISGAFEFENRLLESRDGLSLNGIQEVTFEALSENAIILLLETPTLA